MLRRLVDSSSRHVRILDFFPCGVRAVTSSSSGSNGDVPRSGNVTQQQPRSGGYSNGYMRGVGTTDSNSSSSNSNSNSSGSSSSNGPAVKGAAALAAAMAATPNSSPLPEGAPALLDSTARERAAGGSGTAVLNALSANPYGWPDAARAAREAPLWMLHEASRADTRVPLPPVDAYAERSVTFAPISVPERDAQGRAYATGGRKNAVARVWVKVGDGVFTVNGKPLEAAFSRIAHRREAIEPLVASQSAGAWDVTVMVAGGGLSGQAGAIKHGLAKAISRYEPQFKPVMRSC